ncbi:MAG TPA: dihydroorotate dehydrogenase (quinone), partial [Micromonosporaceae bacterium]
MLYERLARPVLFRLGHGDAEVAHETTLRTLERIGRRPAAISALAAVNRAGGATPRTVFGVTFAGPVGLAAGMDKDGRAL